MYSCLNACGKFGQSSVTQLPDLSFQGEDKATAGGKATLAVSMYSYVQSSYYVACLYYGFCSYSVGASWKEDHIYDTVILAKPSMRSPPTFRYVSQPSQSNNGVAAEYEIPVTRNGGDAGNTNGQSNHQQQQQSSSVNPVYLELYPALSTRNSDTSNTNNV